MSNEHLGLAPGTRAVLITLSVVKAALSRSMPAALQLRLLEGMDRVADGLLTEHELAAIGPACDHARAMYDEISKSKEYGLLSRAEVFGHFLKLNPSLGVVAQMRNQRNTPIPSRPSEATLCELPARQEPEKPIDDGTVELRMGWSLDDYQSKGVRNTDFDVFTPANDRH